MQADCHEWHPQWVETQTRLSYQAAHPRKPSGRFPGYETPSWASDCGTKFNGHTAQEWAPLVDVYWDGPDVDKAVCVIHYESGGDPLANNCIRSATGLMQVMAHLWAPHFGIRYEDLYDPEVNIDIGYRVWLIQGWGAWPNTSKLC